MNRLNRTFSRLASLACVASLAACGSPKADTKSPEVAPAPTSQEPVWPDEPYRAEQPLAGATPQVVIPQVQTFTLKNGIEVYLLERHELPVVSMQLSFDVGSVSDPASRVGLASLAMDLFDEGTKKLDKIAFEERQADLASSVWASAGRESSTVGIQTLKRNLEPTLELLSEMLSAPGMRKGDLERLREQRRIRLAQARATPGGAGRRLWGSVVFGAKHPYGHVGTEKHLDAIRLKDCTRFVKKLGAKGARLFVVGDVTRQEVETVVGDKLGGFKGNSPTGTKVSAATPRAGTVFLVDIPGAAQSSIRVGHTGPLRTAADYESTYLMAAILGGSFSSRINMNLREEHGYTYGARAGFSYYLQGGSFAASSSVRTDATGASLREVAKELQTMRTTDVSAEELAREKDGTLLALPSRFATGRSTLGTFAQLVRFGLPLDYYGGYQERVRAVDIAAVRKAAQAHLKSDGVKVLVVGDAEKIRADLDALVSEKVFGDGPLVVLDADGNEQKG